MAIGILGGTFNPIHNGHLILAQEVQDALELRKVLFIPAKIPPLKKNITPEQHRYNMVCRAIQNNKFFEISDIELQSPKVSYTYDTIQALKQQYTEKIYFIIGSDNLQSLPKWYKWEELLQICNFAIATRPGYAPDLTTLPPILQKQWEENKVVINALEISSTEIRQRIAEKRTLRYLVPDEVIDYIETVDFTIT